ncbi:hypothetical protein RDABS01_022213 [Bienertia sinuspersici]
MDEVIGMTNGYDCENRRKSGTIDYLLNQSSNEPSTTTTGGGASRRKRTNPLVLIGTIEERKRMAAPSVQGTSSENNVWDRNLYFVPQEWLSLIEARFAFVAELAAFHLDRIGVGQPLPLPSPSNSPGEDYSTMMAENPNLRSVFSEGEASAQAPAAAPEQLPVAQAEAAQAAAPAQAPEQPAIPQHHFTRNVFIESSFQTRVELLEGVNSPFLPQEARGEFGIPRREMLDILPTTDEELNFVIQVTQDFHAQGQESYYFKKIVGLA